MGYESIAHEAEVIAKIEMLTINNWQQDFVSSNLVCNHTRN